jgi:UDP-2,3-diacylglucosamine pyrophosphatase LpxH
MNLCIIGDLHLGGRHCDTDGLLAFLDRLPDGCDLVLNGDVIDRYARSIDDGPVAVVLERLRVESRRRRVLWLRGNHDRRRPADTGAMVFDSRLILPRRLLIYHGHAYGSILFLARPFTALLRLAYKAVRQFRPAKESSPDVAEYAKRNWMLLYQVIRHDVRTTALRRARRAGCPAVVCGHSHFPEDSVVRGVRFMNPGAWTEKPVYAVWVNDGEIVYRECNPALNLEP